MFRSKTYKKALIGSTALIGASVLAPTTALAVLPCPAVITSALAGAVCEFDAGSSVTVENGGSVGGISMDAFSPASSFILVNNGGTISNATGVAITINSSSLSSGITNNGHITSTTGTGILISNSSTVSGGITNSGTISTGTSGISINGSVVNGDIFNSGTITGSNGTGIRILSSTVNGGITNNGTITGGGVDSGITIFDSHVNGDITNNSLIQADGGNAIILNFGTINGSIINNSRIASASGTGIALSNVSSLTGNITNTGTISGGNNGISLRSTSHVSGNISNTGAISGSNAGISVDSSAITGAIQNHGTISGGNTGIAISNSATISGGIANSGTIQGGTFAINISANSIVNNINLLIGSNIIGAIDAVSSTLNILGGQINGTVDVHAMNIESNFTTHGNIATAAGTTVANGDKLTIRAGDIVTGNISGTGGTLAFGLSGGTVGKVLGGTTDLTHLNIATEVDNTSLLTNGAELRVIQSAAPIIGGPGGILTPITSESYLWNFDMVDGTGATTPTTNEDLFIKAIQVPASNLGLNQADTNTYSTLQTLEANSTADATILQILANLNGAGSKAAVQGILQASEPTLDGSDFIGAQVIDNETMDITAQQLAMLRSGGETGMASGNNLKGMRAWGQLFDSVVNQDELGGIEGYNANIMGGALGIDTQNISDKGVLGLAFSFGNTNANSRNSNHTGTDADNYQVTLYGDYNVAPKVFINGMLAYGWQNVDTTRFDVGGIGGLTAHGSFNTQQYAARAEVGKNYTYGSAFVTPSFMANYLHYTPGSYTESGAAGADLSVNRKDMNVFELGPRVELSQTYKEESGAFTPSIHGGYRYDFAGDPLDATDTFAAGGPAFNTQGPRPARSTFDVGASIRYLTTANWEFTANYDFQYKSDYTNNAGQLRAVYRF